LDRYVGCVATHPTRSAIALGTLTIISAKVLSFERSELLLLLLGF
jgi:hypothetical protein